VIQLKKKSKESKELSEIKEEIKEFRKIHKENIELNEILKEQSAEYENLIQSFNKTIPRGMFQ